MNDRILKPIAVYNKEKILLPPIRKLSLDRPTIRTHHRSASDSHYTPYLMSPQFYYSPQTSPKSSEEEYPSPLSGSLPKNLSWVVSSVDSFQPVDHHKKKRRRTTEDQLRILNSFFEHTPLPSAQQREELALQTGMNPRSVQVWFQNKRQTMKKKEVKHEESEDAAAVLMGLSRAVSPTDQLFKKML